MHGNPVHPEALEPRRLLSGPLVITQGGTYRGTWESLDNAIPAITIKTSQAVVIEYSIIRGSGNLIATKAMHANVTVRHCAGYALHPGPAGATPGRFFTADGFDRVVLTNNHLEGTAGIHLQDYAGNFTPDQTVKVLRNVAKNIDGRKSNGAGGFMDFNTRIRLSDGHREDGFRLVQFVQLDNVRGVSGIEIGWNKIVNEPGNSRVEDNISIYNSSGTRSSPILIHDNYIDGAYTIKPWQPTHTLNGWRWDWSYYGGGIMLGDGKPATAAADPAFVAAYDNRVVSTTNYGIAISAGHDMSFYNNRIVSDGRLPDGRAIVAQNVGLYIWDSYRAGTARFYNNTARNNVSGWAAGAGRHDWWVPGATFASNIHWAGSLTAKVESAEAAQWSARLAAAFPPPGFIVGNVFNDLDADATQDSNEAGLAGVTVFIDSNRNGVRDAGEMASLSSFSGRYSFSNLPDGAYLVRVVGKSGWRFSTSSSATLSVLAGRTIIRNFGLTQH